jgi:hypothetical protein
MPVPPPELIYGPDEPDYRWWCQSCGTLTNTGDCDCTRIAATYHKQRLIPNVPEAIKAVTQD